LFTAETLAGASGWQSMPTGHKCYYKNTGTSSIQTKLS